MWNRRLISSVKFRPLSCFVRVHWNPFLVVAIDVFIIQSIESYNNRQSCVLLSLFKMHLLVFHNEKLWMFLYFALIKVMTSVAFHDAYQLSKIFSINAVKGLFKVHTSNVKWWMNFKGFLLYSCTIWLVQGLFCQESACLFIS